MTLSTAEAWRFLHTAPSTPGDTYVSAFIPSGAICRAVPQPVNGFFKPEEA